MVRQQPRRAEPGRGRERERRADSARVQSAPGGHRGYRRAPADRRHPAPGRAPCRTSTSGSRSWSGTSTRLMADTERLAALEAEAGESAARHRDPVRLSPRTTSRAERDDLDRTSFKTEWRKNFSKLNRSAQQVLECDWSDKQEAYSLDDECGRYRNTSTNTQHHANSATAQHQACDVDGWMRFTQSNVAKAEREEEASAALCVLCERVLKETAEDLQAQSDTVNEAFTQRCHELTHTKSQLELQLKQVLEQISSQEKNISSLQQAVFDKEAPLRVAQSRLHTRAHRPNMELCRDPPQISLLGEVQQISGSVYVLQQRLCEARDSLARLEENRMLLEKDIGCLKNHRHHKGKGVWPV
ncbi:hypothetical protein QTP86_023965 [Hemibagrus guttatus]|nr:hypothetical protein QTP86_023965 [Hemibagrus guttatus]